MTNLTVANEILRQLGGRRFIAMTGAKDFLGSDSALTFGLPARATKGGVNKVRITLTAMDDYQLEFLKVRGSSVAPIAFREGVYVENLREVFETATGLRCTL